MSIVIRALAAADAAAFQALRLAALLDTPESFASSHDEERSLPLEHFARRLAQGPGQVMLGAFDGDTLVGIVGLRRDSRVKMNHKGHIWGMYVAPAARGHGMARTLMLEVLDVARTAPGMAKVVLCVDGANVAAIALYESLGFVVFGREADAMRLAGHPRDDLHMALRFDASN